MISKIDKGFLISRWWTHYIRDWDPDFAEAKRIIAKNDKWLETLLKKIRGGQRHLPSYIYVIEGEKLTKAYLSYISGRCGYEYVTATKKYFYQSDGDIYPDEDDIDVRNTDLYSSDDLSSLLEDNFLYEARVYDTWFYEMKGDKEMMQRHFESLQYRKKRADEINKKIRKEYSNG
jgi:uncharacterized protein (DUF1810 family)